MIEIMVNGTKQQLSKEMCVGDVIKELKYEMVWFALALNGDIVTYSGYDTTMVHANDKMEILAPVEGG